MAVTIRDVAKRAGVSPSTVSRVLNNTNTDITISDKTQEKVLSVCDALKFQPNIHSRRFFTKKSETIGFIVPPQAQVEGVEHTFADYNLGELLSGVEETITAKGYRLSLLVANDDFINARKHVHLIRDHSLDGLLLWGLRVNETYIFDIQQESFPYILLNGSVGTMTVNSIIADNKAGSFALTEHLVKLKHRRIAYIKGVENCPAGMDRYTGYRSAIKKYGLVVHNDLIEEGDFTEISGYHAMKKLLKLKDRPTAVCAGNDMMAIGAIKAIKEEGLIIPDDIAVAGADGIPLTEYIEPALTTIKTPMYELGVRSVEKLLDIISNPPAKPICEILKTELLIRRSTG